MKRSRSLTIATAAFLPLVLLVFGQGCSSCKKDTDDDVKHTSSAAPPPAPTPVTPATVMPEEPIDAGSDAGDAGVDAGKPKGNGGGSGSIAACCAALQGNANSAPMDQRPYYIAAAQACQGMRNTPSAQQAFAQLRMFLAGAKMPGACK
jgi:hypothetical protein